MPDRNIHRDILYKTEDQATKKTVKYVRKKNSIMMSLSRAVKAEGTVKACTKNKGSQIKRQ